MVANGKRAIVELTASTFLKKVTLVSLGNCKTIEGPVKDQLNFFASNFHSP